MSSPSQIFRNINSQEFKGSDALDNNSACADGAPGATIVIKKVNRHGQSFTLSGTKGSLPFFLFFCEGGSPYPRMEGRKIANLLQQGYRMPKPEHVDDDLCVFNMSLLILLGDMQTSFLDLPISKPCETILTSILYCPIMGEKMIRNISHVKKQGSKIVHTFSPSLHVLMLHDPGVFQGGSTFISSKFILNKSGVILCSQKQFSFVSLALMSKRCCVVSIKLFKICSEADVCF